MSDRFIVSARKYRPDSFETLLGQEAVSATLQRAIVQGKTAHAYLFCGPRGVGKTSAARIFAKAINCTRPTPRGEACGECESCCAFQEQRSINIYELDAASNNSTDHIRRLIEEVGVPPQLGRFKVYIIDEVHMLSQGAFNAFLKTLEEPPEYAIFILATTEKHKILPTILSRCQVYDFKPIPTDTIVQQLRIVAANEQIEVEEKALDLIARHADGGMRDALSIFDRLASFGAGAITLAKTLESLNLLDDEHFFQFAQELLNSEYGAVLVHLDELLSRGHDARHIISGLAQFFRNVLLASDPLTLPLLKLPGESHSRYKQLADRCGKSYLYQSIAKLIECERNYRQSNAKRMLVEMTLLSLSSIANTPATQPVPQPTQTHPTTTQQQQTTAPRPAPQSIQQHIDQAAHGRVNHAQPAPLAQQAPASPQCGEKTPSPTSPPPAQAAPPVTSKPMQKEEPLPRHSIHAQSTHQGQRPRPISLTHQRASQQSAIPGETVSQPEAASPTPTKSMATPAASPISERSLQEAWLQFADHELPPQRILLRNHFHAHLPELREEGKLFVVPCATKDILQDLEHLKPSLLAFLSQQLQTALPEMKLWLIPAEERPPIESKQEWLKRKAAENPHLRRLIQELDLRQS